MRLITKAIPPFDNAELGVVVAREAHELQYGVLSEAVSHFGIAVVLKLGVHKSNTSG